MNIPKVFLVKICGKVGSMEVSDEELSHKFNISKAIMQEKMGVSKLFRFSPNESLVSASAEAAREVITKSGIIIEKINGVFASCSHTTKTLMPGYASQVATELGLHNVLADQIGMACCGGIQALRVAYERLVVDSLKGKITYYLVFAGDAISAILNKDDRSTGLTFSDGVAVLLVTNDQDLGKNSYEITKINTESFLGEKINMISVMNYLHPEISTDCRHALNRGLTIDGKGMFQFAPELIPKFLMLIGEQRIKDDWVLFTHQPSIKMLREIAKYSGIAETRMYMDGIRRIGNTSTASVFLGLEDGLRRKLFNVANTILLGAFGAELTIGSALLEPRGNPLMVVS